MLKAQIMPGTFDPGMADPTANAWQAGQNVQGMTYTTSNVTPASSYNAAGITAGLVRTTT